MPILIVEDSRFNLNVLKHELNEAGYTDILTATSAESMLELLGISEESMPRIAASVDLILLDIVMSGMDGIQACQIVKSCPVYSDLPIIFMTSDRRHFKEAFAAGGMDFIEKGSPSYELLARVQSALRLKQETDIRKERELRLNKERKLAKQLQRSVLPPPIVEPSIQVHSEYIQSDEVSGDMFYWARIDEQRYGVLLIDVVGHGLSAALISMSVRSLLGGMVERVREPDLVCKELNRQTVKLFGSESTIFLTAIYVLVDLEKKELHYFSAGHPPAMVLLANGNTLYLEATGIPIGINPDLPTETRTLPLSEEAKIILYTDGLVENPGSTIRSGMEALRSAALGAISLPNDQFVGRLAELGQNKPDDVCITAVDINTRKKR